jgi:protein-tyrosine phosphatase
MPEILAWQGSTNAPALAEFVAQVLAEGRLAALPCEAGYCLAASGRVADAVERLLALAGTGTATILLREAVNALAWAPRLGAVGQRLAWRLWPGALTLLSDEGTADGLLGELPVGVQKILAPGGQVALRVPAPEPVRAVLARLAGPLVVRDESDPSRFARAEDVRTALGDDVALVLDDRSPHPPRPCTVVRVSGDDWSIQTPGAISAEEIREQAACRIVFVCTGNTCRSPMAEVLFKKRLADRLACTAGELPERGFVVHSAGLAAMMGEAAAPEAADVVQAYGADLSAHVSRPVTADLIDGADLVLAMTQGHVRLLSAYFPELGPRIKLLATDGTEIADPLGSDRCFYQECAQQIWANLEGLTAELV